VSFVKSAAVTDTDVSIERVHLALYDSYVVTGPRRRSMLQQLIKRIALLEALSQSREVRRCICVHRFHGETSEAALRAEGHEPEVPRGMVIIFRRDYISRDAAQGERR
jgi:hypothetical protein